MYNDQHGHGGGYGGGNRFGDKRFSGGGDKPLFKATCAKCGNTCEVPFKPNGSKPVFCRDCFKKDAGFEPRRSGPLDVGGSRPSFGDRGDREMFQATCATCGGRCEVPFRPSGDKPVYCKACFGGKPGNGPAPRTENYAEQFKAINAKLDLLMKVLIPSTTIPLAKTSSSAKAPADKPVKAEKPAEVKPSSAKAPADKPVVEEKPAKKAEKPAKAEKKAEKKNTAKKAKK